MFSDWNTQPTTTNSCYTPTSYYALVEKCSRRDWWNNNNSSDATTIIPTPLIFAYCIRDRCNGQPILLKYCGQHVLADHDIDYHVLRCSQNLMYNVQVNCPRHGRYLRGTTASMPVDFESPVACLFDPNHTDSIKKNHVPVRWFLEKVDEVLDRNIGLTSYPPPPTAPATT